MLLGGAAGPCVARRPAGDAPLMARLSSSCMCGERGTRIVPVVKHEIDGGCCGCLGMWTGHLSFYGGGWLEKLREQYDRAFRGLTLDSDLSGLHARHRLLRTNFSNADLLGPRYDRAVDVLLVT